ncbi:MAG: GDP-mannose 4,6-dehydratase, partial [Armatimonadetes bacterium]|nr:GDP-mannose 4,6-dehydratase [Armatimonadota bacterium]
GITGMVGSVLAREILKQTPDADIFGTYRWRSRMENVDALRNKIRLQECDVRDASSVRRIVTDARPDRVFHLAAQSNVVTSRHAPADTLHTNVVGLVNVLEAIREIHPAARVHVPGSSEEYGLQYAHEIPIKESNDTRPLSPYAVSKVTQDMTGSQYAESYNLHIVRTRAFHHTCPGRENVFVESSFAEQIAQVEAGLKPPQVRVGNLETVRDYSDARDIVRAYLLALEKCVPGEAYNICSEQGRKIGDLLDILLSLSTVKVEVVSDPKRLRDHEAPVAIGDCTKFREATGWKPEIPLEQTLKEILDYWRARVRATAESTGR